MRHWLGIWGAVLAGMMLPMAAQGAFQITRPRDGETVSLLKPMQRALALMTEAQLEVFLTQGTVERMADVTTYPAGIEVEWNAASGAVACYEVRVADNAEMKRDKRIRAVQPKCVIQNLEIGRTYYLQVAALDAAKRAFQETKVQSFVVENLAPRVMNIPGVPNVRDLGGRIGLEGRVIPQGMIFRSAAFNDNSTDGGKTAGKTRMDKENLAIAAEALALKTEIDLRWDSELADMSASPLGQGVRYQRIPSTLYGGLFSPNGHENYRKLFQVFTRSENYPIGFHCILGADRTGSLAAVLLATLGVSREEIIRDFCFTSLYAPFLRAPHSIRPVLDGLAKCGQPGDPLSTQAMRYLLHCGIRSQQIYDFLTIVLGPELAMPSALEEARAREQLQERFQLPAKGLAVVPYTVREETMLQNGRQVHWRVPFWHVSPLRSAGADGAGAFCLHLRNDAPVPTTVALAPEVKALAARQYHVLDPLSKVVYCAPDGATRWKTEELSRFALVLRPQEEQMIVVQPAVGELPDGHHPLAWRPPSYSPYVAEAPAAPAPRIDGRLDDAAWQGQAPLAMTDTEGAPVHNAPKVYLRTDAAHTTLYIAAELQDGTPCAKAHASRDASLWTEDSIELFFASHGDAKTYQVILSAAGCIWDGINGDGRAWTLAQCEFKAARTPSGWTMEAAIPLAQFGFEGALELNVCANNNPGAIHYNLFPTQGALGHRAAISPVLLK